MSEQRNLLRDIVAVLFLCAAAFLAVALLTYHPADPIPNQIGPIGLLYQHDPVVLPTSENAANFCGSWGSLTANIFHCYFGIASFYIVASLTGVAIWMFRQPYIGFPVTRTAGWFASLVGVATFVSLLFPHVSAGPIIGGGGYLGAIGSLLLGKQFALAGCAILATSFSVAGFIVFSDESFFRSIRWVFVTAIGGLVVARQFATGVRENRVKLRTDAGIQAGTQKPIAGKQLSEDQATDDLETELDSEDEDGLDRPYTIRIQGRSNLYEDAEQDELDEFEAEGEYEDDIEDEYEGDQYAAEYEDDVDDAEYEEDEEDVDEEEVDEEVDELAPAESDQSNLPVSSKPHFSVKSSIPKLEKPEKPDPRKDVMVALDQASLTQEETDYAMPDIRLLQHGTGPSVEDQEREVRRKAVILEKTFREFGFEIKVKDIEAGPVIAQYEIELEAGLRLSKITGLADDIAIALRVPSVRIVAPIPGKCTVGIEVPNEHRQMVCLRDVIEESRAETGKMHIPIFLGKDVSGNALVADLAKLPHLLIAGRTGTGKSVCLNAIITSILMTRRPDDVRMLMIDPKMVELSGYGRLPHLMHPVVTDMRKAEAILAWAVDKMEERYALLARAGVRHLTSYNQLGEEELWERLQIEDEDEKKTIPTSLPFIVIVADEMADLMMTSGKEVEQHIIRLAQKSRAVGIHLILATQKPTVDVITGLIKSNLPSRIAFQVASKTDSRVVLDENGADKLLGNGDMLFLGPGTSMLLRGQGTYVSDAEIDMITEKVSVNQQAFAPELLNLKLDSEEDESQEKEPLKDRDELYEQAVDVVVNEGRGSLSLLQRALGIGYGRAARLIDFMAEDGIVGSYNGSKSREVLLDADEWAQMRSGAGEGKNVDDDHDDFDPPPKPPQPPKSKPKKAKPSLGKLSAAKSAAPIFSTGTFTGSEVLNDSESDNYLEAGEDESATIPASAFEVIAEDFEDDDQSASQHVNEPAAKVAVDELVAEEVDEGEYEEEYDDEDQYEYEEVESADANADKDEYEEEEYEEDEYEEDEYEIEAEADVEYEEAEEDEDVEYEEAAEAETDEVEYDEKSDEQELDEEELDEVVTPSLYVEADDDQYEDYDGDDDFDEEEAYDESA